ncbi:hypothetical protein DI041_03845 [Stenotrophomonas maltophilia]|uniref:hypothetical protein n=1 Tax=Stenotrophomonas maltophilia TaxID=40324 RepID=UPI0010AA9305|nr:hypothetical protein [Stenotrophomonas maltophilia]TIE21030.1 hypothetical protein DI034_02285 [Stenotrophomonas maltophilia]TIE64459.1 hypothetical protein DI041_03845 [Stenotrophomonas maltophilia]
MSTDKTLADVKPGGRVRLGDGLPLLPEFGINTTNHASVRVQGYTAQQMRDYARAALSAQPSPGGQDARAQFEVFWAKYTANVEGVKLARDEEVALEREKATKLAHWMEAWNAALADRQPVGEPVAVVGADFDLFWIGSGPIAPLVERNGLRPGSKLYAAPPAQAVDLGAVHALLQRRIEHWRSHLPADPGAPGTREIETNGEHDYNNDVRIYREGIAVMEEAVALIGQTVQAVDLGDFKALYRAYVRLLESGRDRIIDLGGTCDPVDVMEANDVDLQAARRVLDSQAVGK